MGSTDSFLPGTLNAVLDALDCAAAALALALWSLFTEELVVCAAGGVLGEGAGACAGGGVGDAAALVEEVVGDDVGGIVVLPRAVDVAGTEVEPFTLMPPVSPSVDVEVAVEEVVVEEEEDEEESEEVVVAVAEELVADPSVAVELDDVVDDPSVAVEVADVVVELPVLSPPLFPLPPLLLLSSSPVPICSLHVRTSSTAGFPSGSVIGVSTTVHTSVMGPIGVVVV